jgi:hypothetical protein
MTHPGAFLSMFAQVIVGLERTGTADTDGRNGPPEARFEYATEAPENGLTLMRVVTVGFLTVINGHVR